VDGRSILKFSRDSYANLLRPRDNVYCEPFDQIWTDQIRSTHDEAVRAGYPQIRDLRSGFNEGGFQSQPSVQIARFTMADPETFSTSNLSRPASDRRFAVNSQP
jgi:hypothetical protein